MLKIAFLTAKLDTLVVLLSQTTNGKAEKAGTKDRGTRVPYMAWLSNFLRLSFLDKFFAIFQVSCPSYSCCVTHKLVGSYLLSPLQSGLLLFYPFLTLTPCLSRLLHCFIYLFNAVLMIMVFGHQATRINSLFHWLKVFPFMSVAW